MGILSWIIIGAVTGWVAHLLLRTRGGLIRNIVIGILGALVGGFIMHALGYRGVTGFNIWSFLVALLGSVVILAVLGFIGHRRRW